MRILIVEDEVRLAEALGEIMKAQRYTTDIVYDGESAFDNAMSGIYDCIILDVMIPKMDGFEVVRKMRQEKNTTPVIMLTAKDDTVDKIKGLDAGADDYLTKPFSVDELLARLRVTVRRLSMMQSAAGESVFVNGPLQIHFAAGYATLDGTELHLTPMEYRLLCLLARNIGKVLTHRYILETVWGSSWHNDLASLRVFMATLRKKLESGPDAPSFIQTHIGVGYRMLRVDGRTEG